MDPGGPQGEKGDQGDQGPKGDQGEKGDPGDVNTAQLDAAKNEAIATAAADSSANTNAVELIDTSGISDPVQLMLAEKINEMLTAQRR